MPAVRETVDRVRMIDVDQSLLSAPRVPAGWYNERCMKSREWLRPSGKFVASKSSMTAAAVVGLYMKPPSELPIEKVFPSTHS
jgi:hypothetical protein